MTIEERKLNIISWVTKLRNESLLKQLEELVNVQNEDLPKAIQELIALAESQMNDGNSVEHTSARDLIR